MEKLRSLDKLLLHPMLSRIGNVVFLLGVLVYIRRHLRDLDAPVATYALLASGVVLMAAPHATRWVKRRFCRFEILWAFYGFGQTETEVTHQLGSLIRNCQLDFTVHHETFGIADPVPNRRKLLRVGWTNGGPERTGSYGEDAHITLPDPD